MDEWVAFLSARLDEDEAAAKAAPGMAWRAFTEDDIAGASVCDEQWVLLYPKRYDHDNPLSADPGATGPQYIQRSRDEMAAHIARHDPARVLREVAARREILARYEHAVNGDLPEWQAGRELLVAAAAILRGVVAELAAVYSDHPDYPGGR